MNYFSKIKNHKNVIKEIIFILVITCILCFVFLQDSYHLGHDGLFHLARLKGIIESFNDGQIIPRIYPSFNNGFGYATPLFYCDLFLIPFALLYKVGVPIVIAFKIMLTFYTFLSVLISFYTFKYIFKNNKFAPYFATILYSFSNYHLINLHVRLALGEIIVITFIPLLILSIYQLFIEHKNNWILLGTSFSLILFSHNLTFALCCLLFGILLIIYLILNRKNKKYIHQVISTTFKSTILGLLLTSWFLLPMLEQMLDQTFEVQNYSSLYDLNKSVTPLTQLFNIKNILILNNDSFDFFNNVNAGIILLSSLFIYPFCKKNININIIYFISLILVLMISGIIPIASIKIFNGIQFLFRFNIVLFPLLVIITTYIYTNLNNVIISRSFITITIIISIITTFSCYKNYYLDNDTKYISNYIDETELYDDNLYLSDKYNYGELSAGDYLPAGIKLDFINYERNIREMTGEYSYNEIIYNYQVEEVGSNYSFHYNFDNDKLLMIPKTYYKGYRAFNTSVSPWEELEVLNVDNYRLVGITCIAGDYDIVIKYSGTKLQKISFLISIVAAMSMVIICCYKGSKECKNSEVYNEK